MELSTIGTLTKYLQNPSTAFRMTAKLCESLALDISHGLNALHSCYPPFIHRDLKGENILLFSGTSHNGESIVAKIADFGITVIKDSTTHHTNTRTGTCNYLSLQAFKGVFNEASDVWAYGMVLYEIGTRGKLPFEGMPDFQILRRVDQKINPNMNEIKSFFPRTLRNIMVQCWKYKPKARPSAMQIIKLIEPSTIIQAFEATNAGLNDRVKSLQSIIDDVAIAVTSQNSQNKLKNIAHWDIIKKNDSKVKSLMDELRILSMSYSAQPIQAEVFKSVTVLMENAKGPNGQILFHRVLLQLVNEGGTGSYIKGPLKEKDRCEYKAQKDYEGNSRRLVDIIRSTIVFKSCGGMARVVYLLKSSKNISIIRIKDRVNNPLETEYRDVLINLKVVAEDKDIPCQIGEVQLHLESFYRTKPQDHNTYDVHRILPNNK